MFDEPLVDVILVVCRDATHCDRLLPASLPRVWAGRLTNARGRGQTNSFRAVWNSAAASYLLPLSGPYWVSRVTWIPVGQIRDQRDSAFLRRLLFLLAPNNLFWLLFCFSRSGPNDRRVSIKPQSIAFLRGSHLSAAEGYMQMSHYRSWRERGKFRDSRRFLSSTK